jgi:hypothetical protein
MYYRFHMYRPLVWRSQFKIRFLYAELFYHTQRTRDATDSAPQEGVCRTAGDRRGLLRARPRRRTKGVSLLSLSPVSLSCLSLSCLSLSCLILLSLSLLSASPLSLSSLSLSCLSCLSLLAAAPLCLACLALVSVWRAQLRLDRMFTHDRMWTQDKLTLDTKAEVRT